LREYGFGFRRKVDLDLAMYDPTPQGVVDQILQLANVGPGDVLYDLGCGDGRIVVTAAKRYGVRAVGVDVNPRLIAEARANARREGVESQVEFLEQDAKTVKISEATVVTLYLGADGNLRLVERLRSELGPGARVVSRKFQIYGWIPEKVEEDVLPDGSRTALYLWRINEAAKSDYPAERAADSIEKLG
jgi:SAM-dependent methyltransferase